GAALARPGGRGRRDRPDRLAAARAGQRMSELRVLLADDEAPARRGLAQLLRGAGHRRGVGECARGPPAAGQMHAQRPRLVLPRVKRRELDGFEVVERVGVEEMPPVVFVTAFDAFATRAFDVHALDYLVKPFSDARFEFTLARARRRLVEMDAPRL